MDKSGLLNKKTFYGKKDTGINIQARLNRLEKEFKKWPAPSPYLPKLNGPSSHWRIFRTQKDAFNFAKSVSCDLAVFSCESEGFCDQHGQRLYLVTSYDQLWHYYKQLGPAHRHHYEIIPEGSVCRLYFDLEFSKIENTEKDGASMTDIFIKYVNGQLEHIFGIKCSRSSILLLDASTDDKFSQHLIYHMPNAVFQDNIQAGIFVDLICSQLLKSVMEHCPDGESSCKRIRNESLREPTSSDIVPSTLLTSSGLSLDHLKKLLVKNKDGLQTTFCDTGVYTKNRNFRLFLSCKLGKENPLLLAKENDFEIPSYCIGEKSTIEEQIFMSSLIANIRCDKLRILRMPSKVKVQFPEGVSENQYPPKDTIDGHQKSPYPEVDAFMSSVVRNGDKPGAIRQWAYFSTHELLVYEISYNRYCRNIRRHHKSNNVFYVVNLKQGIYYQKCHDPECRNYRSEDLLLPEKLQLSKYYEEFLEEFEDIPKLDVISDADLLLAANQLEKSLSEKKSNHVKELINERQNTDFDDVDDDVLINAVENIENAV